MLDKYLTQLLVFSLLLTICSPACSGPDCIGCKTFDLQNNCIECLTGFNFDNLQGICTPITNIITSSISLGPSTQITSTTVTTSSNSSSSQAVSSTSSQDQNCEQWGTNSSCIKCKSGYTLSNSKCVMSSGISSTQGYYGNFTLVVQNCLRYENKQCAQCFYGFVLVDGLCKQIPDNCVQWNAFGVCTNCFSGYSLQNNQCVFAAFLFNYDTSSSISSNNGLSSGGNTRTQSTSMTSSSTSSSSSSSGGQASGGSNINSGQSSGNQNSGNGNSNAVNIGNNIIVKQTVQLLGCAEYSNIGLCSKCQFRYYLSSGICFKVSDSCKSWNLNNGACNSCYDGFAVSGFECVPAPAQSSVASSSSSMTTSSTSSTSTLGGSNVGLGTPVVVPTITVIPSTSTISTTTVETRTQRQQIAGCTKYNENGSCSGCGFRFYLSAGICLRVSDSCRSWNLVTGACNTCYDGNTILGNECVPITPQASTSFTTTSTVSTVQVTPTSPVAPVFSVVPVATPTVVSPQSNQGTMTTTTVQTNRIQITGCTTYNDNGSCALCGFRFYLSGGICLKVSDTCKSWNLNTGACNSCYDNFVIAGANCVPSLVQVPPISLPSSNTASSGSGVSTTNSQTQTTYSTSTSTTSLPATATTNSVQINVLPPVQPTITVPIVPSTQTTQSIASQTTSGQSGTGQSSQSTTNLRTQQVVTVTKTQRQISFCNQYSLDGQSCILCAIRYYYNPLLGVCQRVNNLCKDYDRVNGFCTQCPDGFTLSLGQCLVPIIKKQPTSTSTSTTTTSTTTTTTSTTALPTVVTPAAPTVVAPAAPTVVTPSAGTSSSASASSTKSSTTGTFSVSTTTIVKQIVGCSQYSADGMSCLKCSFRYYTNSGQCNKVSDLCQEWNQITGGCTLCYNGYTLSGSVCVLNQPITSKSTTTISKATTIQSATSQENANLAIKQIEGCAEYSGNGLACTKCSFRFYNANGICRKVNDLCQTWNSDNGACTACYGGYALSGAECVVSQAQAQATQSGQSGSASTSSSSSSIQGSSASTSTQQASSTAATAATTATKEIAGCAEYSANGLSCSKCSYRFYPLNGACNKVSDLCKSWNLNTGACVECYGGYAISGNDCALIGVSGSGAMAAGSSSSSSGSSSNAGSSSGSGAQGSQGGWQSTTTVINSQNNASGSQLRGSARIQIAGCSQYSSDERTCMKCAFRYYNSNGLCIKVSDFCRDWNLNTGACTQCYTGYVISGRQCVLLSSSSTSSSLSSSSASGSNSGSSSETASGSISNNGLSGGVSGGVWQSTSTTIQTSSNGSGVWSIGSTQVTAPTSSTNASSDGKQKCIFRSVNINGVCVQVDDLCKSWSEQTGACTDCYGGYKLAGPKCVL